MLNNKTNLPNTFPRKISSKDNRPRLHTSRQIKQQIRNITQNLPDGRICLDNVWKKFHKDHNIKTGDFMILHLCEYNTFFVNIIYGITRCPKEYQQQQLRIYSKFNFVNQYFKSPCFKILVF